MKISNPRKFRATKISCFTVYVMNNVTEGNLITGNFRVIIYTYLQYYKMPYRVVINYYYSNNVLISKSLSILCSVLNWCTYYCSAKWH